MTLNRYVRWGAMFAGVALGAGALQSAFAADYSPPPLVGTLAAHPDWPAAKTPADVDSVDHIVAALYDVIAGSAGKPRDWTRFRSLFLPDGRLAAVRPETPAARDKPAFEGDVAFVTPDMYVQRDDPYFKTHGFFERSIANRVEMFGNLVHVWSTYESRHAEHEAPFTRGVNSIQIVHAKGRFWIASVLFDEERPGLTLPERYLK